jgi:drug/metabolite transporter (DMT)-like permease
MILGELISLGTAIFWTLTVVGFEVAGKKVGSIAVNVIRLFIGLILLTITVWIMTGSLYPVDVSQYAWNMLLISGLIGLVIGDLFLFQAFVDVGGRISLLILCSVPIMTSIMGYYIFDEVFDLLTFIGVVITIGSIIVVVLSKRTKEKRFEPHILKGIIFALIGAVAQSVGLVFSKLGMGETLGAFEATQMRVIAAAIGFIIFVTIKKEWKHIGLAFKDKKAMKFILMGSIFGPYLGVTSSLLAMRYTSIGIATTIAQLNVILIIPFSMVLFKEKVNKIEIIASIVAFVGVALLFI